MLNLPPLKHDNPGSGLLFTVYCIVLIVGLSSIDHIKSCVIMYLPKCSVKPFKAYSILSRGCQLTLCDFIKPSAY